MKLAVILLFVFSPSLVWGATPPAPQSGTEASAQIVTKVSSELWAWEDDSLAQYEQLEIDAVRLDILSCQMAESADDFFIDFEQLRRDIGVLVALDDALSRRFIV